MYQVIKNNVITIVKGDYIKFPVQLHAGKFSKWIEYELEDNDTAYFGLMYPNTAFDQAILKKVLTKKDTDENGTLYVTLLPEDTIDLPSGIYYYEIKLLYTDENNVEHIDTVIQRSRFIIC